MVNFQSGDFDSLTNQRNNKFACCLWFVVALLTPYKLFHHASNSMYFYALFNDHCVCSCPMCVKYRRCSSPEGH